MKNVLFILIMAAVVLPGCKKLKFGDKPYLKFTVNGTNYDYQDGDVTGKIYEVNGRKVCMVDNERAHASGNRENYFYVQMRTDIPLNQTTPVMRVLQDDAFLVSNGKDYRLYNGTVTLKKMDVSVSPNNYIEGTFNVYLRNTTNASDEINVSGSFFHNNYDH